MRGGRTRAFVWIAALFLVQNTLSLYLPSEIPWVLLSGVLFFSLTEGSSVGLWAGLFAGLLAEVNGGLRAGHEMIFFGAAGYLANLSGRKFFQEGYLTQFFVPLLTGYLYRAYHLAVFGFLRGEVPGPSLFLDAFAPLDLIVLCAAFPLLFHWLKRYASASRSGRVSAWR